MIEIVFSNIEILIRCVYQSSLPEHKESIPFQEQIKALREHQTRSRSRLFALDTITDLRNAYYHEDIERCPTYTDLNDSVVLLTQWFLYFHPNIDEKSEVESYEKYVSFQLLSMMCLSLEVKNGTTLEEEVKKSRVESPMNGVWEKIGSYNQGEPGYFDPKSDNQNINDFVMRDTLQNLKEGKYRNELKGRRIMILSGKHIGKCGVHKSWNGTAAWIHIDGYTRKIRISTQQEIGVFRKKR